MFWTNICYFSSCHRLDHADTFVNARNISYWDFKGQDLLLLRANTFYLQEGNNTIKVNYNKLHTIETGTFVMPATTGTVECILLGNEIHGIQLFLIRSFAFTLISLAISKVLNLYSLVVRHFLTVSAQLCCGTWSLVKTVANV